MAYITFIIYLERFCTFSNIVIHNKLFYTFSLVEYNYLQNHYQCNTVNIISKFGCTILDNIICQAPHITIMHRKLKTCCAVFTAQKHVFQKEHFKSAWSTSRRPLDSCRTDTDHHGHTIRQITASCLSGEGCPFVRAIASTCIVVVRLTFQHLVHTAKLSYQKGIHTVRRHHRTRLFDMTSPHRI